MKKIDFSNISKYCIECNEKLILKINRDINRKKFCSSTIKENPNIVRKKLLEECQKKNQL